MKNQSSRVERAIKPDRCPECGKSQMADILYGYPAFSDELQQDINEGRVMLGGCCVSFDDPAWVCSQCGLKIFRKTS